MVQIQRSVEGFYLADQRCLAWSITLPTGIHDTQLFWFSSSLTGCSFFSLPDSFSSPNLLDVGSASKFSPWPSSHLIQSLPEISSSSMALNIIWNVKFRSPTQTPSSNYLLSIFTYKPLILHMPETEYLVFPQNACFIHKLPISVKATPSCQLLRAEILESSWILSFIPVTSPSANPM